MEEQEDPGGCWIYNSVMEKMPSAPPCRIQPVPDKGMGMVALKRLHPGDLILAEAPLVFVPDRMDGETTGRVLEAAVAGMSPTQQRVFRSLTDCRNPDRPDLLGRFYTNAMSYGEDAVLCPIMARANHSCRPNAEFVTRKDLGVQHLRAMYVIEEGEEVEINFMLMEEEGLEGRAARREYLRKCYRFDCLCRACALQGDELAADESLRESLKELKSRGVEHFTEPEVEVFLAGMYCIQAKLSFILEVVERVFLSCEDPARRVEYCLHGRSLGIQLYGAGSDQAAVWEDRAGLPGSGRTLPWAGGSLLHPLQQ